MKAAYADIERGGLHWRVEQDAAGVLTFRRLVPATGSWVETCPAAVSGHIRDELLVKLGRLAAKGVA